MMKTVTATAGLEDWQKEFLETPVVAVTDGPRARGGIRVAVGELDNEIGAPMLSPLNGRNLTREEAGELAAALLQLGADDAPVRAVLKIADA